jgi:hypothetical protein
MKTSTFILAAATGLLIGWGLQALGERVGWLSAPGTAHAQPSAVLSDARVVWEGNRRFVVVSWRASLEPGRAYEVCVWRVTPAYRLFMGCGATGGGLRSLRLPSGSPPYDAAQFFRPGDAVELVVSSVGDDGGRTEVGRTSAPVPARAPAQGWLTYAPYVERGATAPARRWLTYAPYVERGAP